MSSHKSKMTLALRYLCCYLLRLGSAAGSNTPLPLVKLQTLPQEPNTATAFGPMPANTTGSTTQSAGSVPIPAPEPTLTGAFRGTRMYHTPFQYSHNLSGTKESSIATQENVTATWHPNSIKFNHCSELFEHYQELFHHYSELYFLYFQYSERDLKHSEERNRKYQDLKDHQPFGNEESLPGRKSKAFRTQKQKS